MPVQVAGAPHMRLHGVYDGRVYASDHRTVLLEGDGSTFERVGRLPVPRRGLGSVGFRLRTTRPWKGIVERVVGTFPTVTVHRLTASDLVATAGRWLYSSHDRGRRWRLRRELPASSGPMGILPTGVCAHGEAVYLGEYPLDGTTTPRLLRSPDRGRSWTVELELDGVRHVHAVQADPYTDDVWVTTGDADDECRIGRLRDGDLEVVGGGSQRWRAVELAFTPDAVLWGVDSRYVDANPILRLDRSSLEDPRPTPTRVHELSDSVFYAASLPVGGRHLVAFSTAAEPVADSTAPGGRATGRGPGRVSVVAAASDTAFTEWVELARYEKRRCPVDRFNPAGRLPVAAAYAFLAADPDRGLFVNPTNTAVDDGAIRQFAPSALDRLGGSR